MIKRKTPTVLRDMPLESLIRALPSAALVMDYGCFGWTIHAAARQLGRDDVRHSGTDIAPPPHVPEGADFFLTDRDSNKIDCADDLFDLVVASHVMEHVSQPVTLFAELVRICKPGGQIYIEAPSDRSLQVRGSGDPENHAFLSFWDDPTHVRPWTPAAFYRLAVSFGCRPLACRYMGSWRDTLLYPLKRVQAWLCDDGDALTWTTWQAKRWICYTVIEKPQDVRGTPAYRYISLKNIPRGIDNALNLYRTMKGE